MQKFKSTLQPRLLLAAPRPLSSSSASIVHWTYKGHYAHLWTVNRPCVVRCRLSPHSLQAARLSTVSPSLVHREDVAHSPTAHTCLLTLDSLRNRNAISRQLLHELGAHLDDIALSSPRDPIRVVVLASRLPTVFCAGADLKERAGFTLEETRQFLASLRNTLSRLASFPIPTIAAVHGMALGGGLELALATHLRVFHSHAQVGLPEVRLGIIPGAGGTQRLPARIGPGRALEMMLTGRRISGHEAAELGLCEVVAEDHDGDIELSQNAHHKEQRDNSQGETLTRPGQDVQLLQDQTQAAATVRERALALAAEIAQGAPLAVRAVLRAAGNGFEAEGKAYESILHTEDRTEALRAFKEKRPPVFQGR